MATTSVQKRVVNSGLETVTLRDDTRLSTDERRNVENAMMYMTRAETFGMNPLVECPGILAEGFMLYRHLFPANDEREDEMLIAERLADKKIRAGKSGCFDVLIGRDRFGRVIVWHQFSTIPLPDGSAACFLQYTGSADKAFMERKYGEPISFRGRGIYTYCNQLMFQIADDHAKKTLGCPLGCRGFFLETEFAGQGVSPEASEYTKKRLMIHEKTGVKALLLRMKDGRLVSPHLQPSLGGDRMPLKLLLCYRRRECRETEEDSESVIPLREARMILNAFTQNFLTEGFPKEAVDQCARYTEKLFEEAHSAILMPATQVPDIGAMAKDDAMLQAQCALLDHQQSEADRISGR